jgi:hypothetical protein
MRAHVGHLWLDYHEFPPDSNERMLAKDEIWLVCLISEIRRLILEGLTWLDLESHCLEDEV